MFIGSAVQPTTFKFARPRAMKLIRKYFFCDEIREVLHATELVSDGGIERCKACAPRSASLHMQILLFNAS